MACHDHIVQKFNKHINRMCFLINKRYLMHEFVDMYVGVPGPISLYDIRQRKFHERGSNLKRDQQVLMQIKKLEKKTNIDAIVAMHHLPAEAKGRLLETRRHAIEKKEVMLDDAVREIMEIYAREIAHFNDDDW